MFEQLSNFSLSELFTPDRLIFLASGFALGKVNARKLGALLVKAIRKIMPEVLENMVLDFLNRFAKGIDRAIADKKNTKI